MPIVSGYQVEDGPLSFGSTYLRSLGGTGLHWLGTCPRMVPNDFRLKSVYGVGVDWPMTYDDLQPYYCKAEWALGVSANKEEQGHFGIWFPPDYDYPMERIPPSYSDGLYAAGAEKATVRFGDRDYGMTVTSLPQARNSIPRQGYAVSSAYGTAHIGERCEGNASCIPICPVQAKYSALRTLGQMDANFYTLVTQAVASRLIVNENGRIGGIEYKRYESEGSNQYQTGTVTATLYIVAAHAVESAKLLLASGAANSSDQVGRNLADHPFFLTWALNPTPVGAFRGPGQTSEIPSFRDGPFRRDFAAFRIDLGNWGWDVATFPPNSNVYELAAANTFGKALRRKLGDEIPRQLRVGYVIEQLPEPGNRVTISRELVDPIGCYRPIVHYNVSDYTRQAMIAANEVSTSLFHAMGIQDADIRTKFTPDSPGYMTLQAAGRHRRAVVVLRIRTPHGDASHRREPHRFGDESVLAQLGSREPVRRRLRRHADHRLVEPDADGCRAGADGCRRHVDAARLTADADHRPRIAARSPAGGAGDRTRDHPAVLVRALLHSRGQQP